MESDWINSTADGIPAAAKFWERRHLKPEWINRITDGMRVKRCHTIPIIQTHTVGDHTSQAMAYVVELLALNSEPETYYETLGRCMMHMLQHDVAEAYTGDMPADAKQEQPDLSLALGRVEQLWERAHLRSVRLTAQDRVICKAADWLQLMDFCVQERLMGNKSVDQMFHNISEYLLAHDATQLPGVYQMWHTLDRAFREAKR